VNFASNTPPNPNLAVTAVGADTQICYDGAGATHHTILDLTAVLEQAAVNALTPSRILDTRDGNRVAANTSRCVTVPGASPGDTAVINITNTSAAGRGYGALRSSDAIPIYNRPAAAQYSSVNFASNTPPNPNLAVTAVGADTQICYDGAGATHHTILDLVATASSDAIPAVEPTRLLDTRPSPGSVVRSDVLNQTLPAGTCGQLGERLGLQLRNGSISGEFATSGSIDVGNIVRQDLDDDGLDDAAYVVSCFTGGTAVFYEVFLDYAVSGPVSINETDFIDSASSSRISSFGFIEGFRLNGPTVVVRWSAKTEFDPNCCTSLLFESQVRSNGSDAPSIFTRQLAT
jgi:hypothetical protein